MSRTPPKKLLVDFLDVSGIAWLASPFYRTRGAILGLHRVLEKPQLSLMPGNVITAELLSQMLAFMKRSKYDFVSLDEIPERLRSSARKRFIAITLDDGYLDNLDCALPIFSEFNAPFAVFPATGLVDRTVAPWWMLLERLLLARNEIILNHPVSGSLRLHCRTAGEKLQAYRQAARWGYVDPVQFTEILREGYEANGLSMSQEIDSVILSWDQTRLLHNHPLATIGVHTVSHLPLTTLSDTRATEEILIAHDRLKSELRSSIRYISYPFGQCGAREFRIAADLEFQAGVTTHRSTLRVEHSNQLLALPRIMLGMSPHASSVSFLRVSLHGMWNTAANWWEARAT